MRAINVSRYALLCAALCAVSANAEIVFQDNFNRPDSQSLGSPWIEINEATSAVIAPDGRRVDPTWIELVNGVATWHYYTPGGVATSNAAPIAYAPLARGTMSAKLNFTFIANDDRMAHVGGLMTASDGFFNRAPQAAPAVPYQPVTALEVSLSKSDRFTPNSSLCLSKFENGVQTIPGCTPLPFQFTVGRRYSASLTVGDDAATVSVSDGVQAVTVSYPLNGFVLYMDQVLIGDDNGGIGYIAVAGDHLIGFDDLVVTAVDARPVGIDVKPNNSTNTINLGSNGVIPVAILSDATFDATQVDPASVNFAGAKVKLIGKGQKYSCYTADVNADGRTDLVCHVLTDMLTVEAGDSIAILEAKTFSGMSIRGSDTIRVVP